MNITHHKNGVITTLKDDKMNAYELADILHQSDFLAMDFAEDAANMLRQQADRIAKLKKELAFVEGEYPEPTIAEKMKEYEKQSEPVAWIRDGDSQLSLVREKDDGYLVWKPLYIKPQTKPLSDEEILEICDLGEWHKDEFAIKFARAIEAKVRGEK